MCHFRWTLQPRRGETNKLFFTPDMKFQHLIGHLQTKHSHNVSDKDLKAFIQNIFLVANIHISWSISVQLLKDILLKNAAAILYHDHYHQHEHHVHCCHYHTYCSCWVLWRRQQQQCFQPESFVQLSGPNILDTPAPMLSGSKVKSNEIGRNIFHLHFWQSIAHVTDNMAILEEAE